MPEKCFVFLVGAACIIHLLCGATGTTLKNNRYQDINDEIKLDPPILSDVMVLYNFTTLEAATETTGNVTVHSTANRDVIFNLTIEGYADCEVSLHAPDGRSFKKAAYLRHVGFAFSTAEVGTWTYSVTCSRLERVSVVVKSRATTTDDNFTITSSNDVLEVKNFTPEDDRSLLKTVTDLNVMSIDETEGLVTLSWTAPGSETDQGNVSAVRYDLRFCQNKEVAVQTYYDCERLPRDKIIVGTFHPQIAGSKETYIISVEANTSSVVFVMKVLYNNGQWSEVSNPVVVAFQPMTTMDHFTTTTTPTSLTSSTYSRTSPTTSTTPTTTPSSTTTTRKTTSSTSTTTTTSATTSTHTSTTTPTSSAPPSPNQTSSLTSTPSSTTTKISTPTSTTTKISTPTSATTKISTPTSATTTTTTPTSTPTPVVTSTTVVDTTTATTPAKHRITTVTVSFTKIVHTSPTVSLSTSEKRTLFIASTVGGIVALVIFIAVVILVLKMRNRVCTKKDKYDAGKRARNMQNIDRMDLVSETRELNSLSPSGRYLY